MQVLTNNNLGAEFWEQRTGLIETISVSKIVVGDLESHICSETQLILVDFYFCQFSVEEQLTISQVLKGMALDQNRELSLFIISPAFSDCPFEKIKSSKTQVVLHNYSSELLQSLAAEGRNFLIKNVNQAS